MAIGLSRICALAVHIFITLYFLSISEKNSKDKLLLNIFSTDDLIIDLSVLFVQYAVMKEFKWDNKYIFK